MNLTCICAKMILRTSASKRLLAVNVHGVLEYNLSTKALCVSGTRCNFVISSVMNSN